VRIPKNEKDAEKFTACEPFIDVPYEKVGASRFPHIDADALKWGALWFADAAFVDPMGAAKRLLEGVETRWGVEAGPRFANGVWHVEKFAAPNLVLATGAANLPVALPWLSVGGVWGERVDVHSDAEIPVTLHQKLSVSANVNGVVRIGATHVRNDPRSEIERVNQLIVDAVGLVPALADQRIVKIYAGHRASVPDHLPVVGPVPDIAKLAARYQRPPKNLQPGDASIDRMPGLYLVNGFGGRGFVFGPRMGSLAAEAVAKGTSVPPVVSPDRFALRYLRKR
jgi:tRNA 5-methylaminomethyl-2-thiouridine biosynthesis bifunctional protein